MGKGEGDGLDSIYNLCARQYDVYANNLVMESNRSKGR